MQIENPENAQGILTLDMPYKVQNEIEVKLRADSFHPILQKLKRLGARRGKRNFEQNFLLDTRKRALRRRGCLLRLRIEHPLDVKGSSVAEITFKGRAIPNRRYKVRAETSVTVADPGAALQIMLGLGYRPQRRYEKFRTHFALPTLRGLSIELDETPFGKFIELEGTPRVIDRAARLLGYSKREYILDNYLALYGKWCRAKGRKRGDMLFAGRRFFRWRKFLT
jgi:adenylate cyclase class 2